MNLTSVWPVLIGAVFGFLANAFTTYRADRRKLRYRWDEPAFEVFSAFAASARAGRDGAARLSESLARATTDEAAVESRERFDVLHAKLRGDFEQVALIGTPEVIHAGRDVVAGVYGLRKARDEQDRAPRCDLEAASYQTDERSEKVLRLPCARSSESRPTLTPAPVSTPSLNLARHRTSSPPAA